ncbi:ATPase, T2SS/T4P/T4SS family [Paenibacillus marinisediminis]
MEQTSIINNSAWGWRDRQFVIRDYLEERQVVKLGAVKLNTAIQFDQSTMFNKVNKMIIEHFTDRFEHSKESEKKFWLSRQHEAIIGVNSAIDWFKREIEEFLRKNGLLGSHYPPYYSDVVEAVYQETYGLGPISTWWKHEHYTNSQAARIIGVHIYFEISGQQEELQEICYQSEADVLRVAKQLSLRNPTTSLNGHNPSLQIDMADGTRVTIIIPPWSVKPMIIFRHYTIKKVSLEDIASYGTYPIELVTILRAIAKGRGTTMLCGPVKSGKSTLLSAMIAERQTYDRMMIIQKDFDELKTSFYYPKHAVMELIMTQSNRSQIFDLILRSDYEYIVVGEMRSLEAEIFLKSCERGLPGALTTYHTSDPADIPSQLADVVIEEQPSKSHQVQWQRVAKNVHFAVVMEELKDRSKRLSQLTVFDWNAATRQFQTCDLVKWNDKAMAWTYSSHIPERVLTILEKYAPAETKRMQSLLLQLATHFPHNKGE